MGREGRAVDVHAKPVCAQEKLLHLADLSPYCSSDCTGFPSIAECLRTPLAFEPVDQDTDETPTETQDSSGVSVRDYPVLDLASEWAAVHMPALEKIPMIRPPDTYNTAERPIQREFDFYPSLTSCAFVAPNEAIRVLGVDASLASGGPRGRFWKAKCALGPWKPMHNSGARTAAY